MTYDNGDYLDLVVYTDGSSMHNGKPNCYGGWAACFDLGNKKYVRYGNLPAPSSNNRGEIYGVLFTMMTFKARKDFKIKIYSDSQYVCKSINEWRHKWKRNNYEGIKNPDLLIPLFNAWDEHGNCSIEWVRGHNGHPGNELADEWAGKGMRSIDGTMVSDLYDIKLVEEKKYS